MSIYNWALYWGDAKSDKEKTPPPPLPPPPPPPELKPTAISVTRPRATSTDDETTELLAGESDSPLDQFPELEGTSGLDLLLPTNAVGAVECVFRTAQFIVSRFGLPSGFGRTYGNQLQPILFAIATGTACPVHRDCDSGSGSAVGSATEPAESKPPVVTTNDLMFTLLTEWCQFDGDPDSVSARFDLLLRIGAGAIVFPVLERMFGTPKLPSNESVVPRGQTPQPESKQDAINFVFFSHIACLLRAALYHRLPSPPSPPSPDVFRHWTEQLIRANAPDRLKRLVMSVAASVAESAAGDCFGADHSTRKDSKNSVRSEMLQAVAFPFGGADNTFEDLLEVSSPIEKALSLSRSVSSVSTGTASDGTRSAAASGAGSDVTTGDEPSASVDATGTPATPSGSGRDRSGSAHDSKSENVSNGGVSGVGGLRRLIGTLPPVSAMIEITKRSISAAAGALAAAATASPPAATAEGGERVMRTLQTAMWSAPAARLADVLATGFFDIDWDAIENAPPTKQRASDVMVSPTALASSIRFAIDSVMRGSDFDSVSDSDSGSVSRRDEIANLLAVAQRIRIVYSRQVWITARRVLSALATTNKSGFGFPNDVLRHVLRSYIVIDPIDSFKSSVLGSMCVNIAPLIPVRSERFVPNVRGFTPSQITRATARPQRSMY